MFKVTAKQVISVLRAVGVRSGDGLLVHSALQYLGRPEGGVGMYLDALAVALRVASSGLGVASELSKRAIPGQQLAIRKSELSTFNLEPATIVVPTFTSAFARGEPYDPSNTPSQGMGAFPEFVRRLPGAQRTPHPMRSVGLIGGHATDLAARDTLSAFDPGSAFERILELDFKLLLLGASIQAASIVHYSEQRAGVPYRCWKEFTGPVKMYAGNEKEAHWETRTYRVFVRDPALDPRLNLFPIQRILHARRQWASHPLNYGTVSLCRLRDFVAAADDLLSADPWALVENRPEAMC